MKQVQEVEVIHNYVASNNQKEMEKEERLPIKETRNLNKQLDCFYIVQKAANGD